MARPELSAAGRQLPWRGCRAIRWLTTMNFHGCLLRAVNAACRREVMKYTGEWGKTSPVAYWVDMPNAYITYDNRYIETVWWVARTALMKRLSLTSG